MPDSVSKKILVVDDNKQVLSVLSDILRRAKYEVVSTTKGKEAVDLATSRRPDLVILDIVMPDMSGSEVAASLVENPSTANIPIVFLTGILSKQEQESIDSKAGKRYVIAKPVTGKELLETVRKLLPI